MKKFTVCGAAVALCCLAGNVQAQEPEYPASASTEVFDFTPWNDDKLLLLFAQAADEGRKYPTKEEFEAAGLISIWNSPVRTYARQLLWKMQPKTLLPMYIPPVGCG